MSATTTSRRYPVAVRNKDRVRDLRHRINNASRHLTAARSRLDAEPSATTFAAVSSAEADLYLLRARLAELTR